MPIEMPKGLPFSVDTWTPQSEGKRHHFLTHAHRDHLAGISSRSAFPIYATRLTKSFALRYFPHIEESLFVEMEVGHSVVVRDPDGDFKVTAFDANHCPGAVMFLFEGGFGNILHTGDCRLTPDCLHCLPMQYITKKGKYNLSQLDYLFLDCTFVRCSLKIPSKQSAIQQVINCIWKHPNAPVVYLACDMLGQEEILVQVSKTFGSKIYVDETNNSECFHSLSLNAPEILTHDDACRFQVIEGFPRLNERASQKLAEARANLQAGPLFIRPSAQWFAGNNYSDSSQVEKPGLSEAVRDEFGIWHVLYSMHSSRDELEWALQLLQPKWVISTTPPCRAMELDYVKKHCYKTNITSDDPLWKLLKVGTVKSPTVPHTTSEDLKNVIVPSVVETSEVSEVSMNQIELETELSPPPPSKRPTFTLFGRVRQGLEDTDLLQEKKPEPSEAIKETEEKVESSDIRNETEMVLLQKDVIKQKLVAESDVKEDTCSEKLCMEGYVEREMLSGGSTGNLSFSGSVDSKKVVSAESEDLCVGSSTSFNSSLKRLYRSMNVPVPRPLPSLTELYGASKQFKLGYGSVSRSSYI